MRRKLQVIALSLVVAHLVALALAASPAFHHWFHGDSDDPGHVCAATALVDGQIDCTQPVVFPIGSPDEVGAAGDFSHAQCFPLGFLPTAPGERAPPAA